MKGVLANLTDGRTSKAYMMIQKTEFFSLPLLQPNRCTLFTDCTTFYKQYKAPAGRTEQKEFQELAQSYNRDRRMAN
jgi:hypothetical protein